MSTPSPAASPMTYAPSTPTRPRAASIAALIAILGAAQVSCGEGSSTYGQPNPATSSGSGGAAGEGGDTTSSAGAAGSGGAGTTAGAAGSGEMTGSGGAAGTAGAAGSGGSGAMTGSGGAGGALVSCDDMATNGGETDVDCGGPTLCPRCEDFKACFDGGDCQSMSCVGNVCLPPGCSDGVPNGQETGVDCGGPICAPCGPGEICQGPLDCTSGVCSPQGVCLAPACNDSIKNGSETDIDCGGMCPTKCPSGQKCNVDSDCVSSACDLNIHICQCPKGMVIVPILGGGTYCIDATEVTYTDYKIFYDANPSIANQPPYCAWNQLYTPTSAWPPAPGDNHPVAYIDWCDAYAYCKYVGKHLCGKVGGGANNQADLADATKSEWFDACSAQNTNVFPYGPSFVQTSCNVFSAATVTEDSLGSCQGGASALLRHMSGNVAEWDDSCSGSADQSDQCLLRGGSFSNPAGPDSAGLQCNAMRQAQRSYSGADVGFRCCQ